MEPDPELRQNGSGPCLIPRSRNFHTMSSRYRYGMKLIDFQPSKYLKQLKLLFWLQFRYLPLQLSELLKK